MGRIKQKKVSKKKKKKLLTKPRKKKPFFTSAKISRDTYQILKDYCNTQKPKVFISSVIERAILEYIEKNTTQKN